MSKSAKYIISIFSIIILLLILIPFFFSLDSYKNNIVAIIKEQTGRELKINDKMSFAILPSPNIKITNVELSSLSGAKAKNLIEVDSAKAKLALLPLLTGNIVISDFELDKPVINLEKLTDGRNTWELEKRQSLQKTNDSELPVASPSSNNPLRSLPFIISNIKILNGNLNFIEKGQSTSVENVDCKVNVENIEGPINFSLKFKLLGQNIVLDGKVKEMRDQIPLFLQASVFKDKISVNGILDIKSNQFKGDINVEGDFKNFESIPEELRKNHNFNAILNADKDRVHLTDIKLNLGSISGTGEVIHSLNTGIIDIQLGLNPGDIKFRFTSDKKNQEQLTGHIKFIASNPDSLIKVLKIENSALKTSLNSNLNLNSDLFYSDQNCMFKNMDFIYDKVHIKGDIGVKNWSSKTTFPYNLNIVNVSEMFKLLGHNLPISFGSANVKGETSFDKEVIVTDTLISALKSNITSKGKISTKVGTKSNLILHFTGGNLAQTLNELSIQTDLNLGAFNLEAAVEGDLISSKNLNILIGKNNKSTLNIGGQSSAIKSSIDLSSKSDKPHFNINAELSAVNLSNLSSVSDSRSSRSAPASSAQKSSGHWSRNKIDLSGLNNAEGSVHIKISKLINNSLIFDNIDLKAELGGGIFKINSITGGLYGGKLEGHGSLSGKGNHPLILKASLNNASLKNIVSEGGKIKLLEGIIDFNCDLDSQGASQFEYVSNLHGAMHLNGRDGKISGINLQKIIHTLKNPKDVAALGETLKSASEKGETAFHKLSSDISINKGIMNLDKCELASSEVAANASGHINLPQFTLDTVAAINVGIKNMPEIKIHISGSLDNPHHALDTKAIVQYFTDHVLDKALQNIKKGKLNPKDILHGVFNNDKNDSAKEEKTQEDHKPSGT